MTADAPCIPGGRRLDLIWRHIAADNPAAAARLLDRIEQRWQQLALYPYSSQPRGDLGPRVRHLVVGEYLSFYRVEAEEVLILRVLHGREKSQVTIFPDL